MSIDVDQYAGGLVAYGQYTKEPCGCRSLSVMDEEETNDVVFCLHRVNFAIEMTEITRRVAFPSRMREQQSGAVHSQSETRKR